jgi:hypothetical protein
MIPPEGALDPDRRRLANLTAEPRNRGREIAHGALRGSIAAMAMTGMRVFTVSIGVVERDPPEAIFKERVPGLTRGVPRQRRRGAVELAHWTYGAVAGAAFAALPASIHRRAWAGPVYGLGIWLGFELMIAPTLGLEHAKELRLRERSALAVDHLLYGFVLSELRRRPQA